jgi:hypothetical protein
LTCNPFCRRICCDVDPDEVSAVESDDDEGIEQIETDSWNYAAYASRQSTDVEAPRSQPEAATST